MIYLRNGGVRSKKEKMDEQWNHFGIWELYGPYVFRGDTLCGLCVPRMKKNWTHGLRFEEGNFTQLGRDQQLMRAALSQHAAILRRPFNQDLRYGAPHLDRDRRGEERPR